MPAELAEQRGKAPIKKIKIFKYKQYCAGGNNAYQQPGFAFWSLTLLNVQACKIINRNRDKKDEDINRNERHVKQAACHQKHGHSLPWGQREVKRDDHRKENGKLERIKEHDSTETDFSRLSRSGKTRTVKLVQNNYRYDGKKKR
jgi:hypothetical protein